MPAGGPGSFILSMRALRPELDRINGTIGTMQPGAPLGDDLAFRIQSVLLRLRAIDPPLELRSTYEIACEALADLLTEWTQLSDGRWVLGFNRSPRQFYILKTSLGEFLGALGRFDR